MAKIDTLDDLFNHYCFLDDCKIVITQLYNTHKQRFLRLFIGICLGIKIQAKEILDNEHEHPKGTFCIKTSTIKVIYKKQDLEIISVDWIKK